MTDDAEVPTTTVDVATVKVRHFLPWPMLVTIAALAVGLVVAMVGLITFSFQSSDDASRARAEAVALQRQVTDLRTQATCVQVASNQVGSALAAKIIAIGDVQGTLADFVIAVLNRDPTATPAIKAKLIGEAKALNDAGKALEAALVRQRQALATC